MNTVINYFDRFDLKTKKQNSYMIWKDVRLDLLKGLHLDSVTRQLVKHSLTIKDCQREGKPRLFYMPELAVNL